MHIKRPLLFKVTHLVRSIEIVDSPANEKTHKLLNFPSLEVISSHSLNFNVLFNLVVDQTETNVRDQSFYILWILSSTP